MMEKILFWAVVVWMIGLLVLGVIAVRDIWKDTLADEKNTAEELKSDGEKNLAISENVQNTTDQKPQA